MRSPIIAPENVGVLSLTSPMVTMTVAELE